MIELIKQLVKEGFEVMIIEVKPKESVTVTTSMFEIPKAKSFKIKSVEIKPVESKQKRINWKTINKIKEAKGDGATSAECAKDLGLSLAIVNKYWV